MYAVESGDGVVGAKAASGSTSRAPRIACAGNAFRSSATSSISGRSIASGRSMSLSASGRRRRGLLVDYDRPATALPEHELRAARRIMRVERHVAVAPQERRHDARVRGERAHGEHRRQRRPLRRRAPVERRGVGRSRFHEIAVGEGLPAHGQRGPIRKIYRRTAIFSLRAPSLHSSTPRRSTPVSFCYIYG